MKTFKHFLSSKLRLENTCNKKIVPKLFSEHRKGCSEQFQGQKGKFEVKLRSNIFTSTTLNNELSRAIKIYNTVRPSRHDNITIFVQFYINHSLNNLYLSDSEGGRS